LYVKAAKLEQFGVPALRQWAEALLPVLAKFAAAAAGEVDTEFWNLVCDKKPGGSGQSDKVGGWITTFIPFNTEGEFVYKPWKEGPSISIDAYPAAAVELGINFYENLTTGRERKLLVYAGVICSEAEDDTAQSGAQSFKLRPCADCVVFDISAARPPSPPRKGGWKVLTSKEEVELLKSQGWVTAPPPSSPSTGGSGSLFGGRPLDGGTFGGGGRVGLTGSSTNNARGGTNTLSGLAKRGKLGKNAMWI
jgi:hypothetical protein